MSSEPEIEDPDTTPTQERYEKAVEQLKNAVKVGRNDWKAFQFSDMEKLSEGQGTVNLRVEINKGLGGEEIVTSEQIQLGQMQGHYRARVFDS